MKYLLFALSLVIFIPAGPAFAEENKEIEYLLSFVAASGCVFIRNGSEHEAKEAAEHLQMKYNYVRNRIKTADDFIGKIATKSSITRRKYKVRCAGEEFLTEKWLKDALAAHRESVEKKE
jgi:hypothetical protein